MSDENYCCQKLENSKIISISYANGKLCMFGDEVEENGQHVKEPINFCPFCGSKITI